MKIQKVYFYIAFLWSTSLQTTSGNGQIHLGPSPSPVVVEPEPRTTTSGGGSTTGQQDGENLVVCNICGDDENNTITIWDGMVPVSPSLLLTCQQIYDMALDQNVFDQQQCNQLQLDAFIPCGCTPLEEDLDEGEGESGGTTTPASAPTRQPVVVVDDYDDDDTTTIPLFICNICGDGYEVGNWFAMVPYPDPTTSLSCIQLDGMARQTRDEGSSSIVGPPSIPLLDEIQCTEINLLAFEPCECRLQPITEPPEDDDGSTTNPPPPPPTTTTTTDNTSPSILGPPPDCYTDLNEIAQRELLLSQEEILIWREIILCPNTVFVMGRRQRRQQQQEESSSSAGLEENENTFFYVDGFDPISPRPNAHYKCGYDGKSRNNCILDGGDFSILSTSTGVDDVIVDYGIIFEGITIQGPMKSSAIFSKQGDITFIDCIFRNQQNLGTILILFGDDEVPSLRRLLSTGQQQEMIVDEEEMDKVIKTTTTTTAAAAAAAAAAATTKVSIDELSKEKKLLVDDDIISAVQQQQQQQQQQTLLRNNYKNENIHDGHHYDDDDDEREGDDVENDEEEEDDDDDFVVYPSSKFTKSTLRKVKDPATTSYYDHDDNVQEEERRQDRRIKSDKSLDTTFPPSSRPTAGPITPRPAPAPVPQPPCLFCDGDDVENPDLVLEDGLSCSKLQELGLNGGISITACPLIQANVRLNCVCPRSNREETNSPSSNPSNAPSLETTSPTVSLVPTTLHSASPTNSNIPSHLPTDSPSLSSVPTLVGSNSPTKSVEPSNMPTDRPSSSPSRFPSFFPSEFPSEPPSFVPSEAPTQFCLDKTIPAGNSCPAGGNTDVGSCEASADIREACCACGGGLIGIKQSLAENSPTSTPTKEPTSNPSAIWPSIEQTSIPSTIRPSIEPTSNPSTSRPSSGPTSTQTSSIPTSWPTSIPTTTSPTNNFTSDSTSNNSTTNSTASSNSTTSMPAFTPSTNSPTAMPSGSPFGTSNTLGEEDSDNNNTSINRTDAPTGFTTTQPTSSPTQDTSTLTITFQRTIFENIEVGPHGDYTRPGIITADSERVILWFEDVKFRNNMFGDPEMHERTWAIKTSGPLGMIDTCFENNEFLGIGSVLTVGYPPVNAVNNFGTSMEGVVPRCQFIAEVSDEESVFLMSDTYDEYGCRNFDADICEAQTESPTATPTSTEYPTEALNTKAPAAPPTYWDDYYGKTEMPSTSSGSSVKEVPCFFVFLQLLVVMLMR